MLGLAICVVGFLVILALLRGAKMEDAFNERDGEAGATDCRPDDDSRLD